MLGRFRNFLFASSLSFYSTSSFFY